MAAQRGITHTAKHATDSANPEARPADQYPAFRGLFEHDPRLPIGAPSGGAG